MYSMYFNNSEDICLFECKRERSGGATADCRGATGRASDVTYVATPAAGCDICTSRGAPSDVAPALCNHGGPPARTPDRSANWFDTVSGGWWASLLELTVSSEEHKFKSSLHSSIHEYI